LRFSVQRVFIRLPPQCIPLPVSFTLILRVAVAANANGAENHRGPGPFDLRGPGTTGVPDKKFLLLRNCQDFWGAAHDGVASGGTSITEQIDGAAALDMRTVTRAEG
jgi:hypothetical protein